MKMKKINVTETIVADIQLHFWEALLELVLEQNFLLVAFQVEDWNRDFSPWEALAVFGTEAFAGQGKRTLKWLVEEGVPYIDIFSGIECC